MATLSIVAHPRFALWKQKDQSMVCAHDFFLQFGDDFSAKIRRSSLSAHSLRKVYLKRAHCSLNLLVAACEIHRTLFCVAPAC
jgi:hypothetical protein